MEISRKYVKRKREHKDEYRKYVMKKERMKMSSNYVKRKREHKDEYRKYVKEKERE